MHALAWSHVAYLFTWYLLCMTACLLDHLAKAVPCSWEGSLLRRVESGSETVTPRSQSLSPGTSASVTPSPRCETRSFIGRPRKSPVWDYFGYNSSTQKSVCQVSASSGSAESPPGSRVCSHALFGKFATNLKQHLKKAHLPLYLAVLAKKEVMAKERMKKPKKINIMYV